MQVIEHEALTEARERAEQVGAAPSAAVCSLLRWVTRKVNAKHAVVVGSRGGVTGLAVLDGMPERSVLTVIEPDAHQHGMTRDTFDAFGLNESVRLIQGAPLDVLDRLTDGGYELVVVTTTNQDAATTVEEAARLLTPDGVFVMLPMDGPGDPVFDLLMDDERFICAGLPLDDGIVLASRQLPG